MAKQDKSPRVHQRDKLKNELRIRERDDLTDKQKQIIAAALDKNTKCIILDGPPGVSKSYTSILSCLKLLNEKRVGEIIYIRSLVQSKDGETGYLAGDLEEKTYYYNYALFSTLEEMISKNDIEVLTKDKRIITYPTSMLRSYNFHNAAIVAEEAQNMSWDSLFTIATRIGMFSKLFVIGDTMFQNDLGKKSGFTKFKTIFSSEEARQHGFVSFTLDSNDIVRSPFVKFIVESVEKYEKSQVRP